MQNRARKWIVPAMFAVAAALLAVWFVRPKLTPESGALNGLAYRLVVKPAPIRLTPIKELDATLEPYRAGHYTQAAALLEAFQYRNPNSVEAAFYLGVSHLMIDEGRAALEPLERARKIGSAVLNDDIEWYLSAAYERIGEWKRATPLLQKLCSGASEYRKSACDAIQ